MLAGATVLLATAGVGLSIGLASRHSTGSTAPTSTEGSTAPTSSDGTPLAEQACRQWFDLTGSNARALADASEAAADDAQFQPLYEDMQTVQQLGSGLEAHDANQRLFADCQAVP